MTRPFIIIFLILVGFVTTLVSLQSCKKVKFNPTISNKPEIITTLKIEFKEMPGGNNLAFAFRQTDSTLIPLQPDTIKLKENTTYFVSIKFLNETEQDAVANVTSEIKTEANNHMVCLQTSTNSLLIRTDSDGTYPLGLESKWINGPPSEGNLTINLMHQPGIKNGDCKIGETDFQAVFPVIIK